MVLWRVCKPLVYIGVERSTCAYFMYGKERAVIKTDVIGMIVIKKNEAATESAEILANEGTKRFERGY